MGTKRNNLFPDEVSSDDGMNDAIFEDEEIDEDAAFTAEDYVKYGDVGEKRSKRPHGDDGADYSDDEDGVFVSISDLLDQSDEDVGPSDEEVDPTQHRKLLRSVGALESDGPPRKRFKKQQSEMYEESEYNVRPSMARVELEDLLPSLEDEKAYGHLKKKLEKLSEKKDGVEKPLSMPVKDRISRKAAYIKAKQDITRWQDTVRSNRIAEQLQFPMNVPETDRISSKGMTKGFTPKTDLENEIASVLQQGGIDEKKITKFENLAANKLTEEEVEERRLQLSKMRSLMLYKEQKGKHQNKIKSKKYRRMVRKGKDKEKLSLEELASVDPDRYQKLLEEKELERIKERLTLKHSNTSKWAKRAVKQKDLGSRQAIQEQIEKKQSLRRKMQSIHDSDSDSEDSEEEEDPEEEYKRMMAEGEKEKGLHSLLFMQRAAKKKHEEYMSSLQGDEEEEEETDDYVGRRKFGPDPATLKKSAPSPSKSTTSKGKSPLARYKEPKKKSGESTEKGSSASSAASAPSSATASDSKNPWMNLKGGTTVLKKAKVLEAAQTTPSSTTSKRTEIDVEDVIEVSEDKLKASNLLSNQKDVLEEAFVGLDVYQEFKEEKEELMAEPGEESMATQELPGWGTWAGEGVKMSKSQKNRLRQKKIQKEKELEERKKKRADAKLKNVIINEENDSKFSKFQVQKLPYEYGTQKQYERTLSQPLGPDWNTLSSHTTFTKPAVVTKPGMTIDPLEAPKESKQKQTKKKRSRK